MLDIGWQEFTLVAFILLIVVGPKDLPKVLKSIFGFINKVKNYAYEFQHSVNEMNDELELSDIRKEVLDIEKNKSILEVKKTFIETEKDVQKIKKATKKKKILKK